MKRETIFLRLVILLLGLLPVIFFIVTIRDLIVGDLDEYTFIALVVYLSAIPFWYALYQALKLLGYIDKNNAFSELSVKTLKLIKLSALAMGALYTLSLPLIFDVADTDDAPGAFAFGLVIIGASFAVATFAAVLQKLIQSGLDLKSENDLTV